MPHTIIVTLALPAEFGALCRSDNVEPGTVLRGFVADQCSIVNYADVPVRTDGYGSNGSDERLMAMEYYVRVGYPWWRTG